MLADTKNLSRSREPATGQAWQPDTTVTSRSQTRPTVLLDHRKPKARVSVILIDWKARESFHGLHYLNNQTVDREKYDLIWVEFYDHKPEKLTELVERAEAAGEPLIDKWVKLGYPDDALFHKHRMYNVGVLLSDGDICVICDSDAMFPPTFIETIIAEFDKNPKLVLHLDEVRSLDKSFYPFNFPTFEQVLASPCQNWTGTTTTGLLPGPDMLHRANYGACMIARRADLLAIGGADEHVDYLGYICGPYELTFRLVNAGCKEYWHPSEFLFHTWHPGESGINIDYQGPSDGRGMSQRALEAIKSRRIGPAVGNRAIAAAAPTRGETTAESILTTVQGAADKQWRDLQDAYQAMCVSTLLLKDWYEFNIFKFGHTYFGLPACETEFSSSKAQRGEYPLCYRSNSLSQVRKWIRRRYWSAVVKKYVPMSILAYSLQKRIGPNDGRVPRLIVEGYCGYNIVSYDGQAYGCLQGEGPFDPSRIEATAANAYETAATLPKLVSRLQQMHRRKLFAKATADVRSRLSKMFPQRRVETVSKPAATQPAAPQKVVRPEPESKPAVASRPVTKVPASVRLKSLVLRGPEPMVRIARFVYRMLKPRRMESTAVTESGVNTAGGVDTGDSTLVRDLQINGCVPAPHFAGVEVVQSRRAA